MFSPCTNYKLKFLSPLEKKSHSDAEFAEVVRQNIATALKVEATDYTSNDVVEWEKQKLVEEQRRSETRNRVRSLLDDVTRNVDNTITDILEGRVHFIPDQTTSSTSTNKPTTSAGSASSISRASDSSSNYLFNTAASTFAKCASEEVNRFKRGKNNSSLMQEGVTLKNITLTYQYS
ncbi:hypothetical protein NQ318_006245 [Aromia moschata]|uniref:Uncharacterized protein n=1 Tax=Aromia moschata TaxID=1265417 RepID=A0AAV8YZ06_9CUCU|nr:hypothetical protein NQ318_006245 [Aromia moschata]